jgi:hypothetical protein
MSIEQVRQKHEARLMSLPNVTGVGIGEKAGREVIKVFVTHKVPESELRPQDVIPRSIDGCAVDVEEIGIVTAGV